ncbi:hypothetical protein GCM10010982_08730 [Bowmanella pacifica]|uniref:Uncharacterized protein n=1 Tax=Bowmanella pacifica TaxID=502051 RepID=A0A918DHR6_9ALTE|nr:hypothetical protein GCM10010982_08730 [Bowmanella pacifica]
MADVDFQIKRQLISLMKILISRKIGLKYTARLVYLSQSIIDRDQ